VPVPTAFGHVELRRDSPIYLRHVLRDTLFLAHYTREKHTRSVAERCAREQLAYSPAERFRIVRPRLRPYPKRLLNHTGLFPPK
jgi:hypothetical protein